MANKIKILTEDVINKIAAGEIVERPASVVKELIENSLDAEATQITVEVKMGGQKLIRVTDNGSGMSTEDAVLSLQRHSTSKITDISDLEYISCYGFRGEALPSIEAVSRLVLTTRLAEDIEGTTVEVEGGVIKKNKKTGCPVGTTVMVRDLFFNTPARLKFIKSNTTEIGHISNTFIEQALANPVVGFKLISNERKLISVPSGKAISSSGLLERISGIFGTEIIDNLIKINFENKFLKIYGFISQPAASRLNKNQQFIFVNKRSIRSRVITHAVYEGYQGFLVSDRHPVIFLFIDIDPALIDVNVHPSKREVRFTNEQGIHELVGRLIKQTLTSGKIIPEIKESQGKQGVKDAGTYTKEDKIEHIKESISRYLSKVDIESARRLGLEKEGVDLFEKTRFVFTPHKKEEEISVCEVIPLVQVNELYIIARDSEGILIIDQHAASERILYEEFKKDYQNSQIKIQELLFPITVELVPKQAELVKANLDSLARLGFKIENFGFNTFIVKTVPVILGSKSDKQVILDIFDSLTEHEEETSSKSPSDISDTTKNLAEEVLKIMACHTAIKAGDSLTSEDMYYLIETLETLSSGYTCPHGRPTMIRITFDELQKRFNRK